MTLTLVRLLQRASTRHELNAEHFREFDSAEARMLAVVYTVVALSLAEVAKAVERSEVEP